MTVSTCTQSVKLQPY